MRYFYAARADSRPENPSWRTRAYLEVWLRVVKSSFRTLTIAIVFVALGVSAR